MTAPHDPQNGARGPQRTPGPGAPGGYGQPGSYGGPPPPPGPGGYGQPAPYDPRAGQYGQPAGSYAQPPPPPGGDKGLPAYSPYGTSYPAGLDRGDVAPVARPWTMGLALGLLILSTLPFIAVGLILLLVPINAESLPPGLLDDPRLVQAGATPDLLISVFRVFGGVFLVLALLYVLFAVLAFQGRNWARIVLTILTVAFALVLIVGLVGGAGSDVPSLLSLLGIIVASVGGVVLLFLRDANQYYARPRT